MLIAQITDPHVAAPGAPHPTGYDPATAVPRVIAALHAMVPRPDLVVLTGDLAAETGTPAEYAEARRLLAPLALPLLAVPGNHDTRDGFRAALAGLDSRMGDGPTCALALDLGPWRILALDTLDPGRAPAGALGPEQRAWAAARLAEAPDRPTLIFLHHPPFPIGMDGIDVLALADAGPLAGTVATHPQVRRLACGHVHRTVHRRWAGTEASTCPAIAYEFPLDLAPGGDARPSPHPPGFQLHRLEPDGSILTHTIFLP